MSLKQGVKRVFAGSVLAAERFLRGGAGRRAGSDIKSVLILEYMLPLGCCVHLTPVYEAIKKSRPEIRITVATRGMGALLLRHNPFVDDLIETPDPLKETRVAARFLRKELTRRGIRPDCVLTGASDQRTRIGMMGMLACGGWRGGYTVSSDLYQKPLKVDAGLSQIANNLRLAGLVGAGTEHREPVVFFSEDDVAAAREMVSEVNPDGRPLAVMVTQNSGGQSTGWHTDRFAEVIRHTQDRSGCLVVYVGTAGDKKAVEKIRMAAGGAGVSLAGRTSVTELAALLAMSDVVVSLDTGSMHVARAVGVPVVVLGPSWQKPVEWLPLQLPWARILRGEDRPDVPAGYRLDEIEAGPVIDALEDLLRRFPPDAARRRERVERSLSKIDHRRQ